MPDNLDDILESPEHTLLATDLGNTEGPLWHPEGYLTFVDLVGNRLQRWDQTSGVSVVREDTGEGNGCTLDRQGRLLMCEGADHRRVTRMEADGTITPIAERWDGKRFNKPNDVICRTDGTIYFTDPQLRLPEAEREYDFAGVFRISPDGQITVATDGCEYPNGLAFSPDESVLYVAISRKNQVCFEEQEKGLRASQNQGLRRGRRRHPEQQPGLRQHGLGRSRRARRHESRYPWPHLLHRLRWYLGVRTRRDPPGHHKRA